MKNQSLPRVALCVAMLAVSLAAASGFAANPPDLTSSLEFVCAPNVERWPSSEVCRHVPDLCLYQGKIYTSGGDWNNNGGPCPIFAIEPYTGTYVKEWTAGTEAVYDFHEFSDGRLYLSAIDIKERNWDTETEAESHEGSHFRREADGNWRNYETALGKGNITQWLTYEYQGYRVHNWDIAEYKGYTFLCGYGISGSTNWGETAMFNATPSLTSVLRGTGFNLRRFYSFLVFDDDIYNFTCQPASGSSFTSTAWEEWRWNDTLSEKQFVKQDASWDSIAPGVTRSMLDYFGGNNVWLWHPRKFGSRVLYILGHEQYNIAPVAAFSAVNQNHHVKATKIDLGGDDVRPYHIFVSGNEVYIVAAKGTSSSTTVENSVWKSTDGVNFTKLFTFNATRPASAVCYVDGTFYFGMGANQYTKKAWAKLGTDISGRIYRIRLPQSPVKVTASASSVSMAEGETKTVSYTLSSAPKTNMTLKVWGMGRNAYWSIDKKTLTFTPQNWSTPQAVSFSVEDFGSGSYTNALVCGTGGTDCDAASTVIKVSGRAFTRPSDPGAIVLYDTMTIKGTAGTANSGVHILTDYVPKRNTVVRSKYTVDPGASPTQFLFCSREAEKVNSYAWGAKMWDKNQARWDINTSQKYSWDYVVTNVSMFLEVKQCKATLTRLYDENRWYLTNDVSMAGFNPRYKMALFQSYVVSGGNYGSWSSSFRGDFNYLQIFEEENNTEVLKHHFLPCVVSNTVKVCDIADNYKLYDIVKTSSGTATIGSGAKAIGLVMPEVSATPVDPDPVEPDRILYVNVPAGVTNNLDSASVTANITNIVKRGEGTLRATAIADYEGDFTLEKGVFCVGVKNGAGKHGYANTIYVGPGASLEFTGQEASILNNKNVVLEGAAAAASSWKFVNKGSWTTIGTGMKFTLRSDATFGLGPNRMMISNSTFDLGGNTLTVIGAGGSQGQFDGCTFSNGGHIVVGAHMTFMAEAGSLTFEQPASGSPSVTLMTGATFNAKYAVSALGWTLYATNNNTTVCGNKTRWPNDVDNAFWNGRLVLGGSSNIATFQGSVGGVSNTVFNVKGALTGSGTLTVGPGWLNLHTADNAYSGAVTVRGQSTSPGAILPGSGGIGLWNGAKCFPNASSVTFTDSARLAFMDDTVTQVGTNVVFAGGADDWQTVSGGSQESRPTIGRFTKTGAGTLEFSAPAAVTEGRVLAGTLKVTHKDAEGATLELMTIKQPQFAKLEFASGTLFDLSDNIGLKVDNLVGSPAVTNSGVFGVMSNWKLTGPAAVMTLKGENVTYGGQSVAGMLAFGEGATFTIADEAAFSNAVAAAGRDGLVVARANWVFGDSTLVNGMKVIVPQPSAGMKYRWEMVVGSDHTTLRLKFAAASGYAAWIAGKGLSGANAAADKVTKGIENAIRYAFDIDPASADIGEPIMQVVSDADGNPAVLTRELAEGRSDVKFGILATTDLSDWSNAKLVPMEKSLSDGLWKPSSGKKGTYAYPAQMFFRYTIEIQQ